MEQRTVSLQDGGNLKQIVPHISAVIPDRVNFETITEALICVSQLAVGTGWAPIYARTFLALGYSGEFWALGLLFVTRAILASLFTALFYVHLTVMTGQLKEEERRLEEERKLQIKLLKIEGLWTVYYQV